MSSGWLCASFAMCFRARDRKAIAARTQIKPQLGASHKDQTDEPQTNRRSEPPRPRTAIAG
eukprot:628390-Alexandrium_andersonii.AAC.1